MHRFVHSAGALEQDAVDGHTFAGFDAKAIAWSDAIERDVLIVIAGSRAELSEALGEAPPLFAYPYGEWTPAVAVAVREALLVDPQPDAVVRYSELAPYDSEVLEVCLASLVGIGGRPHPAVPLLKGRLAVARR